MEKSSAFHVKIFAAAVLATAFSCSAASAAGSVEELKPAASAGDTMRHGVPIPPARTAFDEFNVINDPLYRQGSIEFLKKAAEGEKAGKKSESPDKSPAAPAGVREKAAPASDKDVRPANIRPANVRPADLRDAPSGVRRGLPAPRSKPPDPRPLPADPLAPRKTS